MPNIAKFTRALLALHREGLLKDEACKEPVVLFIRQATEPQTQRHWHATAHFRSQAAAEFLRTQQIRSQAAYHRICKENLAHEHVVPNIVLYRMIMSEANISQEYLESLFLRFGIRATITRAENQLLLRDRMPPEFSEPDHVLHMDPFARYKITGLYESLVPLVGSSWYANAA